MNPTCKKRLGAIRLETMKVVAQEEIAPAIFELVLEGEMVEAMRAGQFLHLRVPDDAHLLRRPISYSSIDKVKKQCHLIYRIEGAGTAIFSTLSQGDTLDVMVLREMVLTCLTLMSRARFSLLEGDWCTSLA